MILIHTVVSWPGIMRSNEFLCCVINSEIVCRIIMFQFCILLGLAAVFLQLV